MKKKQMIIILVVVCYVSCIVMTMTTTTSAPASAPDSAPTGADYTSSCDDLGGRVLVRHNSGKNLGDCKRECSADASCKGFIHKTPGFCQLHDNNDPYGVDICGQGYKVYRK